MSPRTSWQKSLQQVPPPHDSALNPSLRVLLLLCSVVCCVVVVCCCGSVWLLAVAAGLFTTAEKEEVTAMTNDGKHQDVQ